MRPIMQTLGLAAALALAASCGIFGKKKPADATTSKSSDSASAPAPEVPVALPGATTIDDERRANEAAYRFVYLPDQPRLAREQRTGEWVAIVAGRVLPAAGERFEPVKTMLEADAAARAVAPEAKHRFVFQVGEEGDVKWDLGGCELQHVVGNPFIAALEKDPTQVKIPGFGPGQPIQALYGTEFREITVKGPDDRMFLRPEVGGLTVVGAAGEAFCVSTGFTGFATMSSATAAAARLELWEIPGACQIEGARQSGTCRRARARLRWSGTKLDFIGPVAIWPK